MDKAIFNKQYQRYLGVDYGSPVGSRSVEGGFDSKAGGVSPARMPSETVSREYQMSRKSALEQLGIEPEDGEIAIYLGDNKVWFRKDCPYCSTEGIDPIKSDIPGAPDTCPCCGGWL